MAYVVGRMDKQVLSSETRLPLLDVEPSLAGYLPPDGQELGGRLTVQVRTLPPGAIDPEALLDESAAFAAVILEGLIMHRVSIGEQPALRLMGPGDMMSSSSSSSPPLTARSEHRVATPVRIAMLDDRVLWLAQRFPRLFSGLQARLAEQQERVAAQLAVCQLPRVEDRLTAMLWLIAERWGRVTPGGTVVPISLTHDALGELVGARRSTVSLALKQLVEDGTLVRNDGGWLLLEPLPEPGALEPLGVSPQLIATTVSAWVQSPPPPEPGINPRQLSAVVQEMSESHRRDAAAFQSQLDRSRRVRERNRALRDMIAKQPPPRRPAP
jgi:CRP/FNR family transcriptional regulator, cyclic AMP receptor protein